MIKLTSVQISLELTQQFPLTWLDMIVSSLDAFNILVIYNFCSRINKSPFTTFVDSTSNHTSKSILLTLFSKIASLSGFDIEQFACNLCDLNYILQFQSWRSHNAHNQQRQPYVRMCVVKKNRLIHPVTLHTKQMREFYKGYFIKGQSW